MILLQRRLVLTFTILMLLEREVYPFSQSCSRGASAFNACSQRNFASIREDVGTGHHHGQGMKSPTALSMGIRSFFNKGNDDKDSSNENPEDIRAALEAIKADLEAVKKKEKEDKVKLIQSQLFSKQKQIGSNISDSSNMKKKRDESKNTSSNKKESTVYSETVQDRVKRVKSGAMTEDEKLAFLNNALTFRSKESTKSGPPIRQAIPDAEEGQMRSARSKETSSTSNSSARNDPLWNAVVGNSKSNDGSGSSNKFNLSDVVGNDSAKQKYLDMVTDPNRFSSYAAMGGYKNKESPKIEEEKEDSGSQGDAFDNLKSVLTDSEEQERKQAEKERVAEMQRQATEEIRKREEARLQRARDEEARLKREEQEKKEAEDNRQKAIIAAQEEYWAKQVQKKKVKISATISDEDKVKNLEQMSKSVAEGVSINEIRSQQQDETQLLQDAEDDDLRERERNVEILENSVAMETHTDPQHLHEDASANAFVREQQKKKTALDNFIDEQKKRLASLNSPLPSPVSTSRPSRVIPSSKPVSQPSIPSTSIPKSTVSAPSVAPTPSLSLAELTMGKKQSNTETVKNPTPSPEPQAQSPNLSLKEMTMLNKTKRQGVTTASIEKKGPIRQNIPVQDNDDDDEDDDFFEYSRNGSNSNMSIKDIMSRNNEGSSNTEDAASAAKQRSKMWGIDIDKFGL